MLNWFKKKKEEKKEIQLQDLNQELLAEGDIVTSLRYDMGDCKLLKTDQGWVYESLADKKRVHWTKMIDATTEFQKVIKASNQAE